LGRKREGKKMMMKKKEVLAIQNKDFPVMMMMMI